MGWWIAIIGKIAICQDFLKDGINRILHSDFPYGIMASLFK